MLARPNAQLMKTRASATIATSRTAWARVAMRLGAEGDVRTPATPGGTAGRKPRPAAGAGLQAGSRTRNWSDHIARVAPVHRQPAHAGRGQGATFSTTGAVFAFALCSVSNAIASAFSFLASGLAGNAATRSSPVTAALSHR